MSMKSADNVIKRGSTNRNIFKLPAEISLEDVKILVLFYQNRAMVVRKETEDVTISTDDHTISTELSESDTLKFVAGTAELEVCIKYPSGHTLRSHIYRVMIEETLLNQEV
ncbi:hypothetical protein [Eubacterium pyruvativorans]|uniref:hypothetical protein n=1 Tax=Eubacterium pyruvativorans TaxID=155865 RepID=UPI0015A02A9E|nr:hypothetical protein [Eubacterium pyruvativorans]